jgi:hypothetical protein
VGGTPLVGNNGGATGTSFKRCDFNTDEIDEKFAEMVQVPIRQIDIRDFYEPVIEEEENES